MSNLLMDVSGDLDLSNGNLQIVSGRDACAQRLRNAFEFFLGEWFLDLRQGLPYFQVIFEMGTSAATIKSIFVDVILRDKEVSTVTGFDFVADKVKRSAQIFFLATMISGELLDYTVEPLIIDLSKVVR